MNKIRFFGTPTLFILTALLGMPFAARADATLDKIKSRGSVSIGVILSGPPYGYLDPATQEQKGFVIELARAVAQQLGVRLETVPVTPPNRVQFLQQGKVDLLIANMQLTQERAEILSYVPTPYQEEGGAAIIKKGSGIKHWEDLKGKVVCVSQGSNFTKPLVEQYGANVKALPGQPESLLALKSGTCQASVHVSTSLSLLVDDNAEWKDYELPIAHTLIPSPSVIWIRKGENDVAAALDKIVRNWHRTGFLIEVSQKHNLSVGTLRKWQEKVKAGKLVL
ncbi:transporter substrate-binding domain-containing protein [Uliginosibacterium gangwonense]|uniref:transporter substrate-binding domain-containing protein n=1 Tax=Uliginosibacterium gangwonense TaxID=392736 RepID=UPI0003612006|nr:transporter substrate-binding domain-containing protein [Uliginosibacterium gangwonense]